ncbi:MAG: hypothetical protein AAF802_18605 [Planctomycetota bacterium]
MLSVATGVSAETWNVPLGGNAFPINAAQGRSLVRHDVLSLRSDRDHYAVYFRVDRAASLQLAMQISLNAVVVAKSRVLRRLRQEAEGLVDSSSGFLVES